MNRIGTFFLAAALAAFGAKPSWGLPISGSINVLPYTAGPVGPVAADPGIANDFIFAGDIFEQIGITVNNLGASTIVATDGDADGVWSRGEFIATLNNMGRVGVLPANAIFAYYVADSHDADPDGTFAETWSDENVGDVVDGSPVVAPGILLQAARRNDTLAHEIGHMLLDEWRFKAAEGGVHSILENDLVAGGDVRNIPAALADVYPAGDNDQIRNTVGFLSTDATAIIPQTTAMYFQNSQINVTDQDEVSFGIGIVDDVGGGPTVGSGPVEWGEEGTIIDLVHGKIWTIQESAHTAPSGEEEYSFYYHSNVPLDGSIIVQLAVNDIDMVDFKFITGIVPDSVRVEMYSDILADADMVTLVQGPDYGVGSIVDGMNGDIDNFGVTITNAALFAGVQDIVITFRAATIEVVPEPSTLALILAGGALAAIAGYRRRRRRSL